SKFAELGKILERIDDVLIKMGSIRNYYVIKIDTKNDMDRRVKSVLKKL
ncbi:MAG TPA: thiamine-binding protein, partial [Archaeoglobus sp.]|nr:thiamine-binding protein [Archaeoglobus sp.]